MPKIITRESLQNLTYQENKHDDFLLAEVEAILRHPDPTKITIAPPFFPKGGDVYLYKSGPHDRRVKDNYWWVNRGNNFHSKSQKRHAIMKTYFSLKDRNGSKKSDCLNGFRRHIYRLADTKDDKRTLMLVHYLGDEKLHTPVPQINSKVKNGRNGSIRQGKVGLDIINLSVQNSYIAKGGLRTIDTKNNRIIEMKRPVFTTQTLRESSSDDLKNCLEKLKQNTANPSELLDNNLKVVTKIRRIAGNTYNVNPQHHHSVNQLKSTPHPWRENQQNHSQIHSLPVSRANTALLKPVLQNKEKPQVRILDEAIKNQAALHQRQPVNMSFQQRRRLQQMQKANNSLGNLLPKSSVAAKALSFQNQKSLRLNTSTNTQPSVRIVNPREHLTPQNGSVEGSDQSSSSNCPEANSRLQIDYKKLFEEASKLPRMGCDVFVLVSYPGSKPAYWGTKKYVEKFENSECLESYVASNCLTVKLKDSSVSPEDFNHSEAVREKQLTNNTLVTIKTEPMENNSPDNGNRLPDNGNRLPDVMIKREIIDDINNRDSVALANNNNNILENRISSVTKANNLNYIQRTMFT